MAASKYLPKFRRIRRQLFEDTYALVLRLHVFFFIFYFFYLRVLRGRTRILVELRINELRNPNIKLLSQSLQFNTQLIRKLFLIVLEKYDKLCSPIFLLAIQRRIMIRDLEILKFRG